MQNITIYIKLEQSQIPLFASIITHTECFSGKSIWQKKEALHSLRLLFAGIEILPLEEEISEEAGKIRAIYSRNISDTIIASTVIKHKLTLATLNIKDFKKIDGINFFQLAPSTKRVAV